jgi:hypothetical protein
VDIVEVRVIAFFVVAAVVFLHDLAVVDHPPPRTRLRLLHFDEGGEAMQVGTDCALDVPHAAGRFLQQ